MRRTCFYDFSEMIIAPHLQKCGINIGDIATQIGEHNSVDVGMDGMILNVEFLPLPFKGC